MKELIEDNYQSIVKRGFITPSTTKREFLDKLLEEYDELTQAIAWHEENEVEELCDVILVCFNYARHYNIDIESELRKKINYNFQRKD